jgi:hypothetical protein
MALCAGVGEERWDSMVRRRDGELLLLDERKSCRKVENGGEELHSRARCGARLMCMSKGLKSRDEPRSNLGGVACYREMVQCGRSYVGAAKI